MTMNIYKGIVAALRRTRWSRRMANVRDRSSSASSTNLDQHAIKIFQSAVEAVLPNQMVQKSLQVDRDELTVKGRRYHLDHNVWIVGFGKAVIGMVRAVEDMLGSHVVGGVVSVPVGIQKTLQKIGKGDMLPREGSVVRVLEGAVDNLPDEDAERAAEEIFYLANGLTERDILIVLVSGGGSALLPSPIPPVSLHEKKEVTTLLAASGATIEELNTVRKRLSLLKGGGLARSAYPARVLALLLSDIVGDPLELIASGPTVPDNSGPDPLTILYRYSLEDAIPGSAWSILCETDRRGADPGVAARVQNVLVGTNALAVAAARARAAALGYRVLVVSETLTGEARHVGAMFARLLSRVRRTYDAVADGDLAAVRRVAEAWDDVPAEWRDAVCCDEAFLEGVASGTPLCFIAGGETTVTLQGTGKGGRNQEMALAWALENCDEAFASFLSAGTDGQDGPTDAAGAVASTQMALPVDSQMYLDNNNSYSFWEKVDESSNDGSFRRLLKIGLTGTNVMDIQVLLVKLAK